MSVLAITPAFNSPNKHDATGAFHPEASTFVRLHGGKIRRFDNRKADAVRYAHTLGVLGEFSGLSALAFFCHGFRSGIQCGANMRNVEAFAWACRASLAPGAPVVLFACDAARDLDKDVKDDLADGPAGAGGFASELSRVLGPDHWVDAHVTTAHTTINAHVRRFRGGGHGDWIVEPGTALWPAWRATLKADRVFRLSWPLWSEERIRAALSAPSP